MEPLPRHQAYANVSNIPEEAIAVDTVSTACIHCNIRGEHGMISDAHQDTGSTDYAVLDVRLEILTLSQRYIQGLDARCAVKS